jgi:protein TilB
VLSHAACLLLLQDGQGITPSERITARQALPSLEQQLQAELSAEGVDVQAAAGVEDDGDSQDDEVAETGYVDEQGQLKRPWCPQTRILEHREMVSSDKPPVGAASSTY